ncbi:RE1, partial [Symbiodinium pilosum]
VFRSGAVEDWCDKHGIHLDIVPGEAHWKIGTCENAIKGVKSVMDKLSLYDMELSPREALAEAVASFNHKELIRGFSPAQHILGQAPDETGRFLAACQQLPPDLLVENAHGEFARSVKLRAEAEKAQSDWSAEQRTQRALHSRHRPCFNYRPGELVFYWRTQEANKSRRQPGGKHGRFLGPARILATESRTEEDGTIRPGGAIWLVKGRSLLKACPEQLRRATHREELIESLAEPSTQQVPWSFHAVAEQIGGNRFEDITAVPEVQEWHRAKNPAEEVQPSRFRFRTKRPAEQALEPLEQEPREDVMEDDPGEQGAAVAIEIPMPETNRGSKKAWEDLGAYFTGSLKRRAVELSEKKMTHAEREEFRGAKATEVKNFIASNAFHILPDHLKPDRSQAIHMRWILTWKLRDDGTRKPKARAVLLGYQDESYAHQATTSPVMTRQSRQLLLQLAAWKRWSVKKGDVTGAFLQSREYPDKLCCVPTPEICEALNIAPGSITQVRRACYGLVDAPLEWWRSVDTFLRSLGFERMWADSCCWVLRQEGILRGVISGHVDDFLFAGKSGDRIWESKLEAIKTQYKWGDWEEGKFTQCGVVVEQTPEGFELSQPHYLDGLHEIGLNATRRKDRSSPTSERERTQLRALLGGLSWHAQQVAPYLAAEVGMLLTEVSRSTVETIIKANILLSQAKGKSSYKMKIHSFNAEDLLTLVAWVDAGNANRSDGGSTQGIFAGMSTQAIHAGEVCGVSPIAWHSQKIDRTCRSPGAAEAQAAINGEDSLYYARFQWSEFLYGKPDLHQPDEHVKKTGGCLVTDSRNVYDKLDTEMLVVKGAEKRTNIELLALKEAQWNTGVSLRWVHSEAQLANSLTKSNGQREYEMYVRMGHQ